MKTTHTSSRAYALALGLALVISLTACNDNEPSVTKGALSINQSAEITTGEGVALSVPVALNASRIEDSHRLK